MFFLFIRRMKSAVVLLPVLLIALGSFLVFLFKDSNFNGFFGSMEFMMNYTFFGRCCEFFVGIALALIFKKNDSNRSSSYFTYVGLAMMILCLYFLSQAKGSFELGIRTPMGKMINTFALPVSGIAVFYYGLLTEKTLLSKILSSKIFVLLGKSSYVFYLIHMGVFGWVILKFTNSILLLFVLLNIVSVLFFSYIEEPLNHYLRKKLRRQQILN